MYQPLIDCRGSWWLAFRLQMGFVLKEFPAATGTSKSTCNAVQYSKNRNLGAPNVPKLRGVDCCKHGSYTVTCITDGRQKNTNIFQHKTYLPGLMKQCVVRFCNLMVKVYETRVNDPFFHDCFLWKQILSCSMSQNPREV